MESRKILMGVILTLFLNLSVISATAKKKGQEKDLEYEYERDPPATERVDFPTLPSTPTTDGGKTISEHLRSLFRRRPFTASLPNYQRFLQASTWMCHPLPALTEETVSEPTSPFFGGT
ncbi:hypothetical protein J6590_030830 [Homalodisca vitripennis]|nr:hypothetical protein J6590_030830 [Homalodisca vitripennis]